MAILTTANTPPEFPNEPLMYPVRLQLSHDPISSQLYAYPSQRPRKTLVQLQTTIPAIVEYILGPTWHDQLNELGMIRAPQSDWTNGDETTIALRVLRGDGAIMDHAWTLDRWWVFQDGFGGRWLPVQQQQNYIFGWPTQGGVWVLCLPPLLDKAFDDDTFLENEMEEHQRIIRGDKTIFRKTDGSIYYGDLVKSENMDDLYQRLQEKGAAFYANIEDSAEIIESGLLNAEVALQKEPIMESWVAHPRC